jgi:predicted O-linked N-acetylglucosamine transferase (SPINDLY family)
MPGFFDVWMRLLKAVPGSVLWLLQPHKAIEENLRSEAAARDVDPKRLVFSEGLALHDHLARHRLADLFLDTLPINAHTTASDALWAGLPLLTCAGDAFVGRVAGSLLHAAGLPELVTNSVAEYEAKALELATNPQKLAQLKQKLAANLPHTPLFDIGRYTGHLEKAYARMQEIRGAGQPPQTIVVNAE